MSLRFQCILSCCIDQGSRGIYTMGLIQTTISPKPIKFLRNSWTFKVKYYELHLKVPNQPKKYRVLVCGAFQADHVLYQATTLIT